MRIHYLQHVPFEILGTVAQWSEKAGVDLAATRLFAGDSLPPQGSFDALIILGGPMSIHDESDYPWLIPEKRFVRETIDAGKPILGICLGSQLLAEALGARVFNNREREVGWFAIEKAPGADHSRLGMGWPESLDVMHWHGETFDLPEGACHLARSAVCENQAFSADSDRLVGLQFHLEATPGWVAALATNAPRDLRPGRWVQTQAEMLSLPDRFRPAQAELDRILDVWAKGRPETSEGW